MRTNEKVRIIRHTRTCVKRTDSSPQESVHERPGTTGRFHNTMDGLRPPQRRRNGHGIGQVERRTHEHHSLEVEINAAHAGPLRDLEVDSVEPAARNAGGGEHEHPGRIDQDRAVGRNRDVGRLRGSRPAWPWIRARPPGPHVHPAALGRGLPVLRIVVAGGELAHAGVGVHAVRGLDVGRLHLRLGGQHRAVQCGRRPAVAPQAEPVRARPVQG